MNIRLSITFVVCAAIIFLSSCQPNKNFDVLVFSKTGGFRHSSIETGQEAIRKLGAENGFSVDVSEDATIFNQQKLAKYEVILFLHTTGEILDEAQQLEFERYIQAGGNFVGVHAAADTEYEWDFYGKLVGAYFESHPAIQKATIDVVNTNHKATSMLPAKWERADEWYNYKNINPDIEVLMKLDESSYEGGKNGEEHPIAWCQSIGNSRAFYTGLGHTEESFSEELYLKHLLGGINWAAGDRKPVHFDEANVAPSENRFTKVVLDAVFDEPMELEILPDESIIFVERKGTVKRYTAKTGKAKSIMQLNVYTGNENGLLGVALDPNFLDNFWVYMFYSDPVDSVQNIARFTMNSDFSGFDRASEKILLKIKHQRHECCHSGGSLEFGPDGSLFISAGDDTNPFASDGYSPSDERPNRKSWDAQRSSANSRDLRGKVLRILPQADGTYKIPAENLFADGKDGRPEIYAMGCRNPFRISIDQRTGYLYWGDVGPDAQDDNKERGFRGHDEVNQARQAGFFGWPLFVGNNKPYRKHDFATGKSGAPHNPEKPINNSPNNTGIQTLPPAQSAFIWYPYAKSDEFPLVKSGGRNAMAGEVYYYDDYEKGDRRFPKYFDKKLFTYDWIRGWIMVNTMDEEGNWQSMERFMPSHKFSNPVDMKFSAKGDLYVLEYGTGWFLKNTDARLSRIAYNGGNRRPIANFETDVSSGSVPLTVNFDGTPSSDADADELKYEWYFGNTKVGAKKAKPSFTFNEPGEYRVKLVVTDKNGKKSSASKDFSIGNALANVEWEIEGNKTFYWAGQPLKYSIKVNDVEDGELGKGIQPEAVLVSMDYLEEGFDMAKASLGHKALMETSSARRGEALIVDSDCAGCHLIDKKSAGPAYQSVAAKYAKDAKAPKYLANKIIKGGGGVWGETAMAAHPNLSLGDAMAMAQYILSLGNSTNSPKSLPVAGNLPIQKSKGLYILTASYTDKGFASIAPTTSNSIITLRPAQVQASNYNEIHKGSLKVIKAGEVEGVKEDITIVNINNGGYIKFKRLDLTNIKNIQVQYSANSEYYKGGTLELLIDGVDGKVLSSIDIQPSNQVGFEILNLQIPATKGVHDVYFRMKNESGDGAAAGFLGLKFMK